MVDTKLSALNELAATPADNDEVYIRDVSEGAAAESKRITIANLLAGAGGAALTVIAGAGTEVFNGTSPTSWTDLDLSGTIGSNNALVVLKKNFPAQDTAAFRQNGDTDQQYVAGFSSGVAMVEQSSQHCLVLVPTDSSGVIEWITEAARASTTIDVVAYIK